jgi:hypothetical protein
MDALAETANVSDPACLPAGMGALSKMDTVSDWETAAQTDTVSETDSVSGSRRTTKYPLGWTYIQKLKVCPTGKEPRTLTH